MNINVDVDKIINTLSTKFNKIFCDREFVCCVVEDLQVILKNRDRCCVVVFPLLGRNYLKAVQYQAKIFDLEAFTLGSGKNCSLAVCDTKFFIKKEDSEDQIMTSNEQGGAGSNLKKKRPERQLYIPPAQRRLPVSELPTSNSIITDHGSSPKTRKQISNANRKKELPRKVKSEFEVERPNYNEDIRDAIINEFNKVCNFSYMWWKYELFESSRSNFKSVCAKSLWKTSKLCNFSPEGSNIFELESIRTLYILSNDYLLWQPKVNVLVNIKEPKLKVISLTNLHLSNLKDIGVYDRTPFVTNYFIEKTYLDMLREFNIYCDVDVLLIRNKWEPKRSCCTCRSDFYYIVDNNCDATSSLEEVINGFLSVVEENQKVANITKIEKVEDISSDVLQNSKTKCKIDLLESKPEIPHQNVSPIQKNNLKNNVPNTTLNYLKNTINLSENVKVKNDLEEEKEIMRKTKENINRKTRPIIKYVDDINDTLKIERNDVNNWEDLFDEDGQLQEDLLKEIVHKVGSDVTIVKAKEDYSDYFTKHVNVEELEHMVELYDFPASLETHDLIHAFSDIKSDAMYIKWVDDTHAILVLGSSSQAQKAINVRNPLIKVRPMTAASKSTLSIAYQNDLKPAMKRPPTNLQTARRLITTHLGTKSGISKEKSAKEKDDLKAAREMKKLVKKNEQDAWDGNLRSSMN